MILFSSPTRQFLTTSCKRSMSHNTFPYMPSRFQWTKFKDMFNLYFFIAAIPLGLATAYAHIFVGPATLSEIPKGYVPHHWEYYKNPVTRFLAKYLHHTPQQDYEKFLHYIFEGEERKRILKLQQKVANLMKERMDYKAYYYRPVLAKYHRRGKQLADELEDMYGD